MEHVINGSFMTKAHLCLLATSIDQCGSKSNINGNFEYVFYIIYFVKICLFRTKLFCTVRWTRGQPKIRDYVIFCECA
jgi:hypothetical protein